MVQGKSAFTLIELLVVISIIGLLLAVSLPAITGLTGATSLSTGTRQVANLLTLARSEAIAQNTAIRFAVVVDWPGDPDSNLRKFNIWIWDRGLADYTILTDWETLPSGVIFEPLLPDYLSNSEYGSRDPATIQGDYFLDAAAGSEFESDFRNQTVRMRYVEFRPSGAARVKTSRFRNVILCLTEGFRSGGGGSGSVAYTNQTGGAPRNWAQINTDTLTGRLRIHRP